MNTADLLDFRSQKDQFFSSFESPLTHADRASFEGLRYYDPNPDLVFTVQLQPGDNAETTIQTTDGRERVYRRAGEAVLEIGETRVSLIAYDTGHPGYFIPFRDSTSGQETYGGGRYLDIEPNPDGTITIDFNMAYNPYCVYNDGYSCPLPPQENWLEIPIEAGELSYQRQDSS